MTVVPNITTSSFIISTARVFVPPADIGVKQEDAVVGEVEKVTNQQLKLAQQKLAELQHHAYSQISKPTDVATLERIGMDSQGFLYWYNGSKIMFQSPNLPDQLAKPKESDLTLVCKSFVQWQNKLKLLRSSCHEADSKLAQIIKESFLPRVKIATKRKPKDPTSQLVPRTIPSTSAMQLHTVPPPSITFTNTSIAPTNIPPSHIQQQQVSQINPASLMTQGLQGSILVVPHSNVLSQGHGFPLLPVFANTAVIMPQNVSHPSLGIETRIQQLCLLTVRRKNHQ